MATNSITRFPEANEYRDYLIRAFNQDVPFDQFVIEHLAGDQVTTTPRRHPDKDTNESIVGTGFWYLHESVHAPTDVRQWEADHIDNRIDTLTRGFLGLDRFLRPLSRSQIRRDQYR